MAQVTTITNAQSATGQNADWIVTAKGLHWLHFRWAGTPGSATPKVRNLAGGLSWATVQDASGDITITANTSIIVHGNAQYSVDVGTATSALTITTEEAAR